MNNYFDKKILNDSDITDYALAVYIRVTDAYYPGYIIHKNTFMNQSSFGREVFTRAWHLLIDRGYILQEKGYVKGRINYSYELPEVLPDRTEVIQSASDTPKADATEYGKQDTKNRILIDEHEENRRNPDSQNNFIDNLVPSNISQLECYHTEAIETILREELGENYTESEAIKLLSCACDKYVRHRKNVKRSHWAYYLKTVTQKACEWVKGKYHRERKEVTAENPKQTARTETPKKKNGFMNFDQREYDFDDLEAGLLNKTFNAFA